jgi:nicotinamidase-related amidase
MLQLDPHTTALVLIDLQKGITSRKRAPYTAESVVNNALALANLFRQGGTPVVLVNVGWTKDGHDLLHPPVDESSPLPADALTTAFSDLVDGLAKPGDILITKRQWGAFHGTELDLQLRRRGIQTIVLGGIATNMGVESTARQAWEYGYNLVIVEDVTTGTEAEMHHFAFTKIFPKISRVIKLADLTLNKG